MNRSLLLWPIPGRVIVAGCMIVMAAGRLGLYSHATGTQIDDFYYGVLMVVCAIGLIVTEGRQSMSWQGRTLAAISAGIMAWMAIDLISTAGQINTSGMVLIWLAITMVVQAGARREC